MPFRDNAVNKYVGFRWLNIIECNRAHGRILPSYHVTLRCYKRHDVINAAWNQMNSNKACISVHYRSHCLPSRDPAYPPSSPRDFARKKFRSLIRNMLMRRVKFDSSYSWFQGMFTRIFRPSASRAWAAWILHSIPHRVVPPWWSQLKCFTKRRNRIKNLRASNARTRFPRIAKDWKVKFWEKSHRF